jgi:peptidoglycan/xylan/chitin deacetylase (PgdA/CDA1 family)
MMRSALLGMYYQATRPWRHWQMQRATAQGVAPISILFYHRVADDVPNDWTISCDLFSQHIAWLKRHFELISLAEAQARLHVGVNNRPAVALTFDDGYGDNCAHALPLLIKERIPCTYFVATKFVTEGIPFPHDLARGQPLRPNTLEELRMMAQAGIELGAHTHSHADLGQVYDLQTLRREVVTAAHELEAATGAAIRYFAFPYGLHKNLSAAAFHLARQAGYAGVCSAYGGYNFPGDASAGNDPFHLQRIHADPEMLRLKNWLTIDPRKRRMPRFDYHWEQPPAKQPVSV